MNKSLPLSSLMGENFVSDFLSYMKNNTNVEITSGNEGEFLMINLPFGALRGDGLTVYVERLGKNMYKLRDNHYVETEIDICNASDGVKDRMRDAQKKVLVQYGIGLDRGEWFVNSSRNDIGRCFYNFAFGLMEMSVVLCHR